MHIKFIKNVMYFKCNVNYFLLYFELQQTSGKHDFFIIAYKVNLRLHCIQNGKTN